MTSSLLLPLQLLRLLLVLTAPAARYARWEGGVRDGGLDSPFSTSTLRASRVNSILTRCVRFCGVTPHVAVTGVAACFRHSHRHNLGSRCSSECYPALRFRFNGDSISSSCSRCVTARVVAAAAAAEAAEAAGGDC